MPKFFPGFCLAFLFLTFTAVFFPLPGNSQNLPPLTVVIHDSSATQGCFFLSPYTNGFYSGYDRSHQILDQYGRIIYYQIVTGNNQNPTIDFKLQSDGRISYFNTNSEKWFLMDSTFIVVDSIRCVNFVSNQHDMQILPNHHYLMFADEMRIMDLSSYHWFGVNHNAAGSATAQVIGVVIQEFDEDKNLVWEWKGHDHYDFSDADSIWFSNPNKVDWTHANAVEQDKDGNILLSLRHFDEITKINHSTGDIIWRLGGKRNQFFFSNDPIRFTGQHDIRRVTDTSISFFDNGQYTHPAVCRGVEYALDESSKVATLVWQYIYDSSMYSLACGNHQFVENGNHLVDFGFCNGNNPWMALVKADKSEVLDMSFPNNFISYRAFNYVTLPWQLHRPAVDCRKIGDNYYLEAETGHASYKWSTGETTSSIQIPGSGVYWVFVPYGLGYICSERIAITNPDDPCLITATLPPAVQLVSGFTCVPNPASDHVRILFDLPCDTRVSINLATLLGTQIRMPVAGDYPAGSHEVLMDVSSLNKGAYILTMRTNTCLITRKLLVQ
jgi:hypothetical protein